MDSKLCSSCGNPSSDFAKGRRVCKECQNKKQREYYRTPKGRESARKSGSKWYFENKNTEVRKTVVRTWVSNNQDRVRSTRRARDDKNREAIRPMNRDKARKLRAEKPDHFRKYTLHRKHNNKSLVEKIKAGPCTDCGGSFPPCCMDFDHITGIKAKPIADMYGYSQEALLEEISKCELVCACCHRTRTQGRLKSSLKSERRLWLDSLKSKPCSDCGSSYPPESMDFDHITGEKVYGICQMYTCKKERILLEVSKCELVCANCHRIRTAMRANQERAA